MTRPSSRTVARPPSADFFDLEKFPGKRGAEEGRESRAGIRADGDGVPAAEVYDVLRRPRGVDRAFAKLDTIKDDVVWWEAGAQPPQLLADGEVVMTTAYNGRIFNAAVGEGKPFKIVWDGQIYENEKYVIPKGAPNKDEALEFIAFRHLDRRRSQRRPRRSAMARRASRPTRPRSLQGRQDRDGAAPADRAREP